MCKGLEDNFMSESLVLLIKSCSQYPENIKSLRQLLSEENLNYILKFIIPEQINLNKNNQEVKKREKNYLEIFLDKICSYYSNCLNQIVTRLPNVKNIIADPDKYFEDTHIFLLLLVGCATQCNEKFWFHEKIALLDTTNFFRTLGHLKQLRNIIQKQKPVRSSRFLKYFSKSFSYDKQNSNHQSLNNEKEFRSIFDCSDDCPFLSIYQIKIQKDQIKIMNAEEKIKALEMKIQSQTDFINILKSDSGLKFNKQKNLITELTEDTNICKKNGNGDKKSIFNWRLPENQSQPEAELLYKIQMYKNLLSDVAEEWSREEAKYKQLKSEVFEIKQLVNFNDSNENFVTLAHIYKKDEDNECLDNLDVTTSNVPHLIELFENKKSNQQYKCEVKEKNPNENNEYDVKREEPIEIQINENSFTEQTINKNE